MRIPNYDCNKNETQKRSLYDFINEDYRMLVCGQTGCGKTNTVMHMLRKPLVHYDKMEFHQYISHRVISTPHKK